MPTVAMIARPLHLGDTTFSFEEKTLEPLHGRVGPSPPSASSPPRPSLTPAARDSVRRCAVGAGAPLRGDARADGRRRTWKGAPSPAQGCVHSQRAVDPVSRHAWLAAQAGPSPQRHVTASDGFSHRSARTQLSDDTTHCAVASGLFPALACAHRTHAARP
jgi:hypothetical protein